MSWIRSVAGAVTQVALHALVRFLPPPRVIYDRDGKTPYLSRYYLRGRPWMKDGSDPFNETGNPYPDAIFPDGDRPHIYLHRFHRDDNDDALHNHPWAWAFSILLSGGYYEDRRTIETIRHPREGRSTFRVERREVLPFSFNYIGHDDFHRVDLRSKECWSLFVVGPRASSWSFWDALTGETTPWREYINRRRSAAGSPLLTPPATEKAS